MGHVVDSVLDHGQRGLRGGGHHGDGRRGRGVGRVSGVRGMRGVGGVISVYGVRGVRGVRGVVRPRGVRGGGLRQPCGLELPGDVDLGHVGLEEDGKQVGSQVRMALFGVR